MAETSDRVSTLASRYATITAHRLVVLAAKDKTAEQAASDIRTMAASLLRQDETRGIRKLLKAVGL